MILSLLFSRIGIAAMAVSLLFGVYFFQDLRMKWKVSSLTKKVEQLENDKILLDGKIKAKEAMIADLEATRKVERKVIYVHKKIDEMAGAGDDAHLIDLFSQYGMLYDRDKAGNPQTRNPDDKPAGAPSTPTVRPRRSGEDEHPD